MFYSPPWKFAFHFRGDQKQNSVDSAIVSIKAKYCKVLRENTGFDAITQIHSLSHGNKSSPELSQLAVSDICTFKCAPIVNVDVERAFSRYKVLLPDGRYSPTPEHAKLHIIIICNNSED